MASASFKSLLLGHKIPSGRQEVLSLTTPALTLGVWIPGGRRTSPLHSQFHRTLRASVGGGDNASSRACFIEAEVSAATVRIVAVVGESSVSPLKGAPWEEVMLHTAERLKWMDEGFQMFVYSDKSIRINVVNLETLQYRLAHCDFLVVVSVKDQFSADWIKENSERIPNVICFESSPSLLSKLGGSLVMNNGGGIFQKFDLWQKKDIMRVITTVSDAWERHNSDDIRFCLLVIINCYIRPVPLLKNLRAKGLSTLNCMLKNCGSEIINCLFDPSCRKAIQCLNKCSPIDQVCNYQCIASYESPNLEAFSLCVLQRHNCLELDAEIPTKPIVSPLSAFRGEALNHEMAEDLFIGWLGEFEWSWRVVAGQNPAYDQFPCQYQLFYRGKAKGSFWYEPVFRVRTLGGSLVWRRRRYRVRRAKVPGTFHFSVLDNGVVSKEFWTIIDVCEDLRWGLFHYSGAAEAAGLSYTGAVLVSPDGLYPANNGGNKLIDALQLCRIKDWELYSVDNSSCTDPPLGLPQGSSFCRCIVVKDKRWIAM